MIRTLADVLALTLLHTLWLGALIPLVSLGVRRRLQRESATLRYRVALLASGLLLLLPLAMAVGGATRLRLLERAQPVAAAVAPGLPELIERPALAIHLAVTPLAGPIAAVWLAGTLAALGTVLLGLVRLDRLARRARPWSAPEAGLPCPVALSADLASPCAVGWRRPVILLPASLVRTLPDDDLRALLRHEAAHVRRRDFGVNLLHRVLLAPLWFHPAVAWLARRLRVEREQCCDDQSLRGDADRLPLARALVRLAEQPPAAPRLAVAGSDGELGDRVRRLLRPPRGGAAAVFPPSLLVTAGLTVTVLLLLAGTIGGLLARDLLRAHWGVQAIWAEDPAGRFTLLLSRGRVLGAQLDGATVPPARIRQEADRISLLGAAGSPDLILHLEPGGGFRWTPRRPGPT